GRAGQRTTTRLSSMSKFEAPLIPPSWGRRLMTFQKRVKKWGFFVLVLKNPFCPKKNFLWRSIQIYDIENNFNLVYTKNYECSGIICTYYDEYIKQLFLGTTDGRCLIYYGDNSKKGVLDYLQQKGYKGKDETNENTFFYMKNDNLYNLDIYQRNTK
ncbi:hypothetical protein PFDG_04977, partial [Plasmodium falciparum Dd2]